MAEVTIYTTRFCGFCFRAKQLLENKNVAYKEIPVDGDRAARQKLAERSGRHTVPQIWIGREYVGGCDELYSLERAGRLNTILSGG